MKSLRILAMAAGGLLLSSTAWSQSPIEGIYLSPAGENGRGSCRLEVKSMGRSPRYGDELYSLISSGEGACEWTAIGLSRNFFITAGQVTSGGHSGLVTLRWPFGPGGPRLEMTAFDEKGALRLTEAFERAMK